MFQQPIVIATNQIFNYVIKASKHVLLDGTFSHFDYAYQNVSKSLKKGRSVIIMYTYVDPYLAWKFTQAREVKEGRRITKAVFIETLFGSYDTVQRIQATFGNKVEVYVLIRDYSKGEKQSFYDADSIDKYVKIPYSREELEKKL